MNREQCMNLSGGFVYAHESIILAFISWVAKHTAKAMFFFACSLIGQINFVYTN